MCVNAKNVPELFIYAIFNDATIMTSLVKWARHSINKGMCIL